MNPREALGDATVNVILGLLLSIGSFVVSYIVVFTEDIIPMGDMGKYIVVFITLALNGLLVLIIATQKGAVDKAVIPIKG